VAEGLKVRFWAKRGNPAVVPVAAVFVDMAMALLVDMCRMNAGAVLRPVAASLRRRKPDPADAYERFFGCPVQFGAEENAFMLSARDADRPKSPVTRLSSSRRANPRPETRPRVRTAVRLAPDANAANFPTGGARLLRGFVGGLRSRRRRPRLHL